ncbi:MAG: hypothetical protein RLZZ385_1621 [Pseudomonadota bacterium]|jgi:UDP-N-acetylglucosamine 2-epimerase (non-hydrolysing)
MKRLKVMTVVGTRPEIIRLSRVIPKLDQHVEQTFVHTGQNYDYELNEIFFEQLDLRKPDHFLSAASRTAAETIGNVIIKTDQLLETVMPDAVLVLGDTNSCMAILPAKRRKIPSFHMEAGNRCFDQRVPEEINRRLVDHMADVNLTYSDISREYLLREGLPPDLVIKTGSPMLEVLTYYRDKIDASSILGRLGLTEKEYFLVSLHREENIDSAENVGRIISILEAISQHYGLPVLFSTHPRTRKQFESLQVTLPENVILHKPLGLIDYNKLQLCARAVLSDSGTINEESSIFNFPALNLREAHERPEAMEEAAVMMTGLDPVRVLQGLEILTAQKRGADRTVLPVKDYGCPNVSDKVLRIILSYTDYVNRRIWMK